MLSVIMNGFISYYLPGNKTDFSYRHQVIAGMWDSGFSRVTCGWPAGHVCVHHRFRTNGCCDVSTIFRLNAYDSQLEWTWAAWFLFLCVCHRSMGHRKHWRHCIWICELAVGTVSMLTMQEMAAVMTPVVRVSNERLWLASYWAVHSHIYLTLQYL